MLSGFMITHAIHQQIITLVAWYPLILYFFRRSLVEPGWRWVFVTALLLALSTLAGFPQLSLYLHLFLFAYFVFILLTSFTGRELASRPAGTAALKAAAVILFALALAALQLLPTLELADLSQRAQITYEKSTEGQLAWSQLITFLFPKFFGTAGAQGYSYWGPGTYWYFWETCVYLGILPLLLAALSFPFAAKTLSCCFCGERRHLQSSLPLEIISSCTGCFSTTSPGFRDFVIPRGSAFFSPLPFLSLRPSRLGSSWTPAR